MFGIIVGHGPDSYPRGKVTDGLFLEEIAGVEVFAHLFFQVGDGLDQGRQIVNGAEQASASVSPEGRSQAQADGDLLERTDGLEEAGAGQVYVV